MLILLLLGPGICISRGTQKFTPALHHLPCSQTPAELFSEGGDKPCNKIVNKKKTTKERYQRVRAVLTKVV